MAIDRRMRPLQPFCPAFSCACRQRNGNKQNGKGVLGDGLTTATSATRIGSLASRIWVDPLHDASCGSAGAEWFSWFSPGNSTDGSLCLNFSSFIEPFGSACVALACPVSMQLGYQSHPTDIKGDTPEKSCDFLQFHRSIPDFIRKSIDRSHGGWFPLRLQGGCRGLTPARPRRRWPPPAAASWIRSNTSP